MSFSFLLMFNQVAINLLLKILKFYLMNRTCVNLITIKMVIKFTEYYLYLVKMGKVLPLYNRVVTDFGVPPKLQQ